MRSTLRRLRTDLEVPRAQGLAVTLDGYRELTGDALRAAEADAEKRRAAAAARNSSERVDREGALRAENGRGATEVGRLPPPPLPSPLRLPAQAIAAARARRSLGGWRRAGTRSTRTWTTRWHTSARRAGGP